MKKLLNRRLAGFILLLLSSMIVARILTGVQKIHLAEPVLGSYTSDESMYLKTFYLIERGEEYYSAFKKANEGVVMDRKMTKDIFTWRLPTGFYFWKIIANSATGILYWYWILTGLSLISVFLMLSKFSQPYLAGLGTLLLIPYFLDTLVYKSSFLFTEWWAWFFLMLGLGFFIHQQKLISWPLLVLGLLMRELLIIPMMAYLLLSIILKKNRAFFASICSVFFLFYYYHFLKVTSLFEIEGGRLSLEIFLTRWHGFNKLIFLKMAAFSMRQYPLIQYKSNLGLLFLSLIALVINLVRVNANKNIYYLLITGWSMILILPFITSSQYTDYWGILFMPSLLITIPLLAAYRRDKK